jgi:hypothetical protein
VWVQSGDRGGRRSCSWEGVDRAWFFPGVGRAGELTLSSLSLSLSVP